MVGDLTAYRQQKSFSKMAFLLFRVMLPSKKSKERSYIKKKKNNTK